MRPDCHGAAFASDRDGAITPCLVALSASGLADSSEPSPDSALLSSEANGCTTATRHSHGDSACTPATTSRDTPDVGPPSNAGVQTSECIAPTSDVCAPSDCKGLDSQNDDEAEEKDDTFSEEEAQEDHPWVIASVGRAEEDVLDETERTRFEGRSAAPNKFFGIEDIGTANTDDKENITVDLCPHPWSSGHAAAFDKAHAPPVLPLSLRRLASSPTCCVKNLERLSPVACTLQLWKKTREINGEGSVDVDEAITEQVRPDPHSLHVFTLGHHPDAEAVITVQCLSCWLVAAAAP
jgi:hypothetical protein